MKGKVMIKIEKMRDDYSHRKNKFEEEGKTAYLDDDLEKFASLTAEYMGFVDRQIEEYASLIKGQAGKITSLNDDLFDASRECQDMEELLERESQRFRGLLGEIESLIHRNSSFSHGCRKLVQVERRLPKLSTKLSTQ
tara:strand:- start:77 stop:490 length:414 start_codon:yes stop_codon:yes gene_type:complete